MIRSLRLALALTLAIGSTSLLPAYAATENAVDFEARSISMVLPQEPPQLDSTKATDQVSNRVLGHVMEPLTRYGASGDLVPGVAERWEVREDGATFWLREDARWSDGEPVTAHDFVFSWRKVVDPATASEYAFIMYGIENAVDINEGRMPVESLGVVATEDHRLDVSFTSPIAYFDKLVAFGTFYPVRQDFYESRGDRYAAEAEDLLYNGPFTITRWDHGARIELRKNEMYWDAENIWLNAIHFPYITTDTTATLNLFKDEKIVLAGLDSETMENALDQRWRIQAFNDGSVWFLEFNYRDGRITNNFNLRRALALTFDPFEFVNRVVGIPGVQPGSTIFPSWLRGAEGRLRLEMPPPTPEVNYALAREHLEQARVELGLEEFPPLVLLTGDSPTANRQAEFLQTLWGEELGLEIRIDRQIFKQRLAKMTAGEFDIVAAGWGPDYNDPLTFGDLFASWNLNNRGRYANDALDDWVRLAQGSVDPFERVQAFRGIQEELLRDHAIIPTYERSSIYVIHPQVRGYIRRQISPDPDFSRAWLVEE